MAEERDRQPSFRELSFPDQRRLLIKALPLLLGSGLKAPLILQACGGSKNQETTQVDKSILPEQPLELSLIALRPKLAEVRSDPGFDFDYVNKLLAELKKSDKKDLDKTLQALKENVGYLQLLDENDQERGAGTAIRLCESGYYLTAAHLLLDQQSKKVAPTRTKSQVYLPTSGILSPVKSMIFDPTSDLAIFWAPSGNSRAKIPGLQTVDSPLVPGQKLWQLGIIIYIFEHSVYARLNIPYGQVDQNPKFKNYLSEERFILVRGMIPYGGSSGAPIIDSKGNIAGVESGSFIEGDQPVANVRGNYTHSVISPIANFARFQKARVHTFPK